MIRKIKIYIFSLLTFLAISTLPAQIGIKGGPALSDIIFADKGQTPYLSYEINSLTHRLPYITYQFGVFRTFNLNNRISIQPEILFVQKGLNYSMDLIYDDITYIIKIHYLEVPILLKYQFTKSKRSSMLIGPYFSYMISNKKIREVEGILSKDNITNINKTDIGIATSFSYEINNQINIDIKMSYSLVEMMEYLDDAKLDYYGPDKARARNVNLSITVGYYLQLGTNK